MSELRSRCGNTADAFGKVQYGNANRSQSVYDYQLRDLRTDGDYYDDCCVIYALMGIIMMTVAFWVGIIYWIPLCWVVPMTVVYNNSINGMRPPVGVAFKICALLFASLIAGILMLCDNNN